jgi:hypothetical protein
MSNANASAKKRRAPQSLENTPPPAPVSTRQNGPNNTTTTTPSNSALTLPQVIALFDTRLIKLEKAVNEPKDMVSNKNSGIELNQDILNEINNRFEILAEEISNIKDIVLKLQSYTMEVNKTLLEERINVFSDLGNTQPFSNLENIILEEADKKIEMQNNI